MSDKKVSGAARGELRDAAEQWLRDNDPHYASSKRAWMAPTTDALSRALSDINQPHDSLNDLHETVPHRTGAYRRDAADSPLSIEDMQNDE